MEKKSIRSVLLCFTFSMLLYSCSEAEKKPETLAIPDDSPETEIADTTQTTQAIDTIKPENNFTLTEDLIALESMYSEMLEPISSLKSTKPKIYWFIVSWLGTNYKTPDWTNYSSDTWKQETKVKGIDCSGFARVMQDEIFDSSIAGSSQMLLDVYCDSIPRSESKMSDLVFFKAPNSESKRIVHVGVYLMDNYFVHATSARSAAKGLGLKIDSIEDKRWDDEFVATGRIKSQ